MKILLALFLILSCSLSFGQVTPVKTVKVTASDIPFNENIPKGTIIIDTGTGQIYLTLISLGNLKTIAACILGTDIKQITVQEVADEFTATAAQTSFLLTHLPAGTSKVKMYINGIRISNNAYTNAGTATEIYNAGPSNGSYVLVAGDRIQFDYFY